MAFISCFLGADSPLAEPPPPPRAGAFVLPRLRTPRGPTTPGDDARSPSSSLSEDAWDEPPCPPRPCSPAALQEAAGMFAAAVARALAARRDLTLDDVLQDACRTVLAQGCLPPLRPPARAHHYRGGGSSSRRDGDVSLKRRLEDDEGARGVPLKRVRSVLGRAEPHEDVPPLTAAESAVLEQEGLTGAWGERFQTVFRTLTVLQARGYNICSALAALSRHARTLAEAKCTPPPEDAHHHRYRAIKEPRRKAPRTEAL